MNTLFIRLKTEVRIYFSNFMLNILVEFLNHIKILFFLVKIIPEVIKESLKAKRLVQQQDFC